MKRITVILLFTVFTASVFSQAPGPRVLSSRYNDGKTYGKAEKDTVRWLKLLSPLSYTSGGASYVDTFGIDTSRIYAAIGLKQNLVTLTTTGSSGPATFNQGTGALNIPEYGGGGGTPGGSDTYVQYNNATAFGGDSSNRWKQTGLLSSTKSYTGLLLIPNDTARANTDTLLGITLSPKYNLKSRTGVRVYDMKVNKTFITMDSLNNVIIGSAEAVPPVSVNGGANWFGYQAGFGATGAFRSNMLGHQAGQAATNGRYSNFLGYQAGQSATNAFESNFFGLAAGNGATGASNSNFHGSYAGSGATSAQSSNFFGGSAGINATNASNSNFYGSSAGSGATSAANSNFFGPNAGLGATGAQRSNFFGESAGRRGTTASQSNFFGYFTGDSATSSSSNYIGAYAGSKASGTLNSFFGFRAGDGSFAVSGTPLTGSNNFILGNWITLPTAAKSNMADIGNVLYVDNLYSSSTMSATPQTTGKVGINTATVDASAAFQVVSTTAGAMPFPVMTAAQRTAISSPAIGLHVYQADATEGVYVYKAAGWAFAY